MRVPLLNRTVVYLKVLLTNGTYRYMNDMFIGSQYRSNEKHHILYLQVKVSELSRDDAATGSLRHGAIPTAHDEMSHEWHGQTACRRRATTVHGRPTSSYASHSAAPGDGRSQGQRTHLADSVRIIPPPGTITVRPVRPRHGGHDEHGGRVECQET